MNYALLALPLLSAFIGWLTNLLAIKMLFHPKNPVRVFGITFHGIFPKRQQQFAQKLGKLVSEELLSFDEIASTISNPENVERLKPLIEKHIDQFLREKLAAEMPIISAFVGEKTISKLKGLFMAELTALFPDLMQQYAGELKEKLDLEKLVVDKVSAFSSDKLESILFSIMAREFKFVELVGAILGFLIGLLQVGLTLAFA
ncbi:MAG TPA: DUF445 family protein [Phnomibacter sp.]|nr:DUF445 family protein [Phnomibacter sp.]